MAQEQKIIEGESVDPKLKEIFDRFQELNKDCMESGYVIQPFSELGIRITKIPQKNPILKGFRGFKK